MNTLEMLIDRLDLIPHPEGGYYKETYRSTGEIPQDALGTGYNGNRNYSTAIYFLLTQGNFSAFHKINQDEFWHFYDGDPLELQMISPEGDHTRVIIGRDLEKGQVPQFVVPGGYWFASRVLGDGEFSFVGCTVSPGFDFADFVLPSREELTAIFPNHSAIISEFTRT